MHSLTIDPSDPIYFLAGKLDPLAKTRIHAVATNETALDLLLPQMRRHYITSSRLQIYSAALDDMPPKAVTGLLDLMHVCKALYERRRSPLPALTLRHDKRRHRLRRSPRWIISPTLGALYSPQLAHNAIAAAQLYDPTDFTPEPQSASERRARRAGKPAPLEQTPVIDTTDAMAWRRGSSL